ncbi:MAG: hypothetical protein GEU81_14815 [Nitriliruptorales bacterium]|nr:hypothetical protein [Nitriliruptorales bacterium]
MDSEAGQIRELVVEACARIDELDRPPSARAIGELEHLRDQLLTLADETAEHDAADAACGAGCDIDDALRSVDFEVAHRGAA